MNSPVKVSSRWTGLFFGNAVLNVIGLVSGVIIARALGPSIRGEYGVIVTWVGLFCFMGYLSLNEAIVAQLSKGASTRYTLLRSLFISNILALICILFICILVLSKRVNLLSNDPPIVLAYATIYTFSLFNIYPFIALAQAQMDITLQNVARIIPAITYLLIIGLIWSQRELDLRTALLASCAASAFALIVVGYLSRRHFADRNGKEISTPIIWKTALGLHITAVPIILSSNIDKILVTMLSQTESIGYYFVALTAASSLPSALTQVAQVIGFTDLTASTAQTEQSDAQEHYARFLVLISIGGFISVFAAPLVILLFFGQEYAVAAKASVLLVPMIMILSVRSILNTLLRAIGKQLPILIGEAIYSITIISTVSLLYLFNCNGLYNFILAITVSAIAALYYVGRVAQTTFGISIRTMFVPRLDYLFQLRDRIRSRLF